MLVTVVPEQSQSAAHMAPDLTLGGIASAILPQDSTFLRITANLAGGRLGVGLDDDYCVTQLNAGEPGEVAGLQVGDQIVEVNNVLVFEKEIASLIPRESDIIVLGIRRQGVV
jgi:C-terminal processing protease CtpA/Prc